MTGTESEQVSVNAFLSYDQTKKIKVFMSQKGIKNFCDAIIPYLNSLEKA